MHVGDYLLRRNFIHFIIMPWYDSYRPYIFRLLLRLFDCVTLVWYAIVLALTSV
jgi:hypothetical protein